MVSRSRSKSKGKKINPKLWVFCEGESEEAYINFLRSKYRLPSIKIVAKVVGSAISDRKIKNYKKGEEAHLNDETFLFYDGDVSEVNATLKRISGVKLLITTPCLELWYLLHYGNIETALSSNDCEQKLKDNNSRYRKGIIDTALRITLDQSDSTACTRAKDTVLYKNPSSNIYEFIELLEFVNQSK